MSLELTLSKYIESDQKHLSLKHHNSELNIVKSERIIPKSFSCGVDIMIEEYSPEIKEVVEILKNMTAYVYLISEKTLPDDVKKVSIIKNEGYVLA